MNHMNIAVVGCGYVGGKTAEIWKERGIHVTGTTRRPERLQTISKYAQKSVLLKGNDEAEFASLIAANEVILISLGADRPEDYDSAYRHTAQTFRNLAIAMDYPPRRLIYTSSASVYGDQNGHFVDEDANLLSDSEQGKILIETERLYHSLTEFGWHVCILRLAEIYGPGREISEKIKRYQNHSIPGNGQQFTNMVHRDDCSRAIDYALRQHLEGTFNLADDVHPTRKELYHQVAEKEHLPEPHWDPNLTRLHSGNKRVSNHKIKAAGFTFLYPNRILD